MKLSPTKAITTFFNADGYAPLKAQELLDFKKSSPEEYDELGVLAQKALEGEIKK